MRDRVTRWQLRRGDHIYAWRGVYSHHGIYESDEKVIHLTSASAQSSSGGFFSSSSSAFSFHSKCREAMRRGGVVACCLDCFLQGDNLRLFDYSPASLASPGSLASPASLAFITPIAPEIDPRPQSTCSIVDEDPTGVGLDSRLLSLVDVEGLTRRRRGSRLPDCRGSGSCSIVDEDPTGVGLDSRLLSLVDVEGLTRRRWGSRLPDCRGSRSDPAETVLRRANDFLANGDFFGGYNVAFNNCFHFAYYCKTGRGYFSEILTGIVLALAPGVHPPGARSDPVLRIWP